MYMDLRGLPDGADSPAPAMQIMFLDELNVFLNASMSFDGIWGADDTSSRICEAALSVAIVQKVYGVW